MADVTLTIDTGEWTYPDASGDTHVVNNGDTFAFVLSDISATDVRWYMKASQSATTTDDYTLFFREQTGAENVGLSIGIMADANDGTTIYSMGGELVIEDPTCGKMQIFRPVKWKVDDCDDATALDATFEDQFGNSFTWTNVTCAVA